MPAGTAQGLMALAALTSPVQQDFKIRSTMHWPVSFESLSVRQTINRARLPGTAVPASEYRHDQIACRSAISEMSARARVRAAGRCGYNRIARGRRSLSLVSRRGRAGGGVVAPEQSVQALEPATAETQPADLPSQARVPMPKREVVGIAEKPRKSARHEFGSGSGSESGGWRDSEACRQRYSQPGPAPGCRHGQRSCRRRCRARANAAEIVTTIQTAAGPSPSCKGRHARAHAAAPAGTGRDGAGTGREAAGPSREAECLL